MFFYDPGDKNGITKREVFAMLDRGGYIEKTAARDDGFYCGAKTCSVTLKRYFPDEKGTYEIPTTRRELWAFMKKISTAGDKAPDLGRRCLICMYRAYRNVYYAKRGVYPDEDVPNGFDTTDPEPPLPVVQQKKSTVQPKSSKPFYTSPTPETPPKKGNNLKKLVEDYERFLMSYKKQIVLDPNVITARIMSRYADAQGDFVLLIPVDIEIPRDLQWRMESPLYNKLKDMSICKIVYESVNMIVFTDEKYRYIVEKSEAFATISVADLNGKKIGTLNVNKTNRNVMYYSYIPQHLFPSVEEVFMSNSVLDDLAFYGHVTLQNLGFWPHAVKRVVVLAITGKQYTPENAKSMIFHQEHSIYPAYHDISSSRRVMSIDGTDVFFYDTQKRYPIVKSFEAYPGITVIRINEDIVEPAKPKSPLKSPNKPKSPGTATYAEFMSSVVESLISDNPVWADLIDQYLENSLNLLLGLIPSGNFIIAIPSSYALKVTLQKLRGFKQALADEELSSQIFESQLFYQNEDNEYVRSSDGVVVPEEKAESHTLGGIKVKSETQTSYRGHRIRILIISGIILSKELRADIEAMA